MGTITATNKFIKAIRIMDRPTTSPVVFDMHASNGRPNALHLENNENGFLNKLLVEQ